MSTEVVGARQVQFILYIRPPYQVIPPPVTREGEIVGGSSVGTALTWIAEREAMLDKTERERVSKTNQTVVRLNRIWGSLNCER